MRDPHVDALHYRLDAKPITTFSPSARPVEAETAAFSVRLSREGLVVTMHEHHASEGSARAAVEPYLRAWEIRHALRVGGDPEASFQFERAEIVDRDPPPPGEPQMVLASARIEGRATITATATVERGSYPEPPADFAIDPDVQAVWLRWRGYAEGREPLQSMAYFASTALDMHGGRRGASSRFGVSTQVLSTLGRLSSEHGDDLTARKRVAALQPLTPAEDAWLRAAVRALIRRAGEVAADPTAARPLLTMVGLPAI